MSSTIRTYRCREHAIEISSLLHSKKITKCRYRSWGVVFKFLTFCWDQTANSKVNKHKKPSVAKIHEGFCTQWLKIIRDRAVANDESSEFKKVNNFYTYFFCFFINGMWQLCSKVGFEIFRNFYLVT